MSSKQYKNASKITIILPVYNVEKYLPRCLKSIKNQTFKDFCVIAIDDGSTDNSLRILKNFRKHYGNIEIISQENKGLSVARNVGISMAKSEFVTFVDSDDFVEKKYLEELYKACVRNDADISCGYFNYYYEKLKIKIPHPIRTTGVLSKKKAIKKILQDIQIQSYAWGKLYRRTLFTRYDIQYPSNMVFEDIATTPMLFARTRRVAMVDSSIYNYVQREDSILKTPNLKMISDFEKAVMKVKEFLLMSNKFEDYRRYYNQLCYKSEFYCDYFLIKMYVKNRSKKDFWYNLRMIHSTFGLFRSR